MFIVLFVIFTETDFQSSVSTVVFNMYSTLFQLNMGYLSSEETKSDKLIHEWFRKSKLRGE